MDEQLHTHKRTVTYACAHTRAHTRTHTQTHTHTCAHARTHSRTHARTHTRTHTRTQTPTHKHTQTNTHTCTHAHTHAYKRTHTHKHKHVDTQTQTHRHTGAHTHMLHTRPAIPPTFHIPFHKPLLKCYVFQCFQQTVRTQQRFLPSYHKYCFFIMIQRLVQYHWPGQRFGNGLWNGLCNITGQGRIEHIAVLLATRRAVIYVYMAAPHHFDRAPLRSITSSALSFWLVQRDVMRACDLRLIWATVRRRRATNSDLDSTWDGTFFASAPRRSFHTPSMACRSGLLFGKSVCSWKPASAIACWEFSGQRRRSWSCISTGLPTRRPRKLFRNHFGKYPYLKITLFCEPPLTEIILTNVAPLPPGTMLR